MKLKLLIILVCLGLVGCGKDTCSLVKEGTIKNIQYLSTGSIFGSSDSTILTFQDDSTFVLGYKYSIPAKEIKIYYCNDGFLSEYYIISLKDKLPKNCIIKQSP